MNGRNDAINESLSALFDNEHGELDLRRVLKSAEQTDAKSEIDEKWSSYNQISQVLKKQAAPAIPADFLAGIQDAIAEEQIDGLGSTSAEFNGEANASNVVSLWQRYAGKGAIAACVTFAFLIGVNQLNENMPLTAEAVVADSSSSARHESVAVVPSGFELPPLSARTVSTGPDAGAQARSAVIPGQKSAVSRQSVLLTPEMEEQLNRMILKHSESASANGGMGVIPFTRVGSIKSESE